LAFSYWTIKPWFLTEGKFAAILIIPSSWGSQLTVIYINTAATSNNRQREERKDGDQETSGDQVCMSMSM
jgi:hypothetical protein